MLAVIRDRHGICLVVGNQSEEKRARAMSSSRAGELQDRLLKAAERLKVATEASAGPLGATGLQVWARWPRDRLTLAYDVLSRVRRLDGDATVETAGAGWRARRRNWSFTGSFEEAVAMLALHVCDDRRLRRTGADYK